jgi:hypothetical protein
MIQIATALDMSDTALSYFMKEHEIVVSLNLKKNLPTFILILNKDPNFEKGSSIILRILASWGRVSTLVSLLENFTHLWTADNIRDLVRILIVREDWETLDRVVETSAIWEVMANVTFE